MKRSSVFSIVPIAMMAIVGCSGGAGSGTVSAIPTDGIELKMTGKPGDKEKQEVVMDMSGEAPPGTPGVPADGKIKMKMTLVSDAEVQTVKDGKVTYKMTITDAKMEGNMPDNPAITALKGKSGTVVYDSTGKVSNVSGDLGQAGQMMSSMEFPTKKVKKGDSWEQTTPSGGMPVILVNTIDGMEMVDGINCVVVSSKLKEKSDMMSMAKPGKTWIDPSNGRPVKAEMSMSMTSPKMTISMTTRRLK